MHCDKNIFFEVYNLQQTCQNERISREKRADNSTLLRVSSRPLILLRRLRRMFAYVYVHAFTCMHVFRRRNAQERLETRASKGNRSTTLNDSDDNLPAPHLPRLPLFIDAVSKGAERTKEKIKRTCV